MNQFMDSTEKLIKRTCVGYKISRVSAHLEHVTVAKKSLFSYKSFLGIKYSKQFIQHDTNIEFTHHGYVYDWNKFIPNVYVVEFAFDEYNKVAYWRIRKKE